jgi:hypothetical protein
MLAAMAIVVGKLLAISLAVPAAAPTELVARGQGVNVSVSRARMKRLCVRMKCLCACKSYERPGGWLCCAAWHCTRGSVMERDAWACASAARHRAFTAAYCAASAACFFLFTHAHTHTHARAPLQAALVGVLDFCFAFGGQINWMRCVCARALLSLLRLLKCCAW